MNKRIKAALGVEELPLRLAPAVTAAWAANALTVDSDGNAEHIQLTTYAILNPPGTALQVKDKTGGGAGVVVTITNSPDDPTYVRTSNLTSIAVNGNAGNDILDLRLLDGYSGTVSVNGGGNDDLINASPYSDSVRGEAGTDSIAGLDGHDTLRGDDEGSLELTNDNLDGGYGNDCLFGENGHDSLIGFDGTDTLSGGYGSDTLSGQDNNDELFGGNGWDCILGGAGHDILNGENGNDKLFGEDGFDTVQGGLGNDLLDGGSALDRCYGDDGNDTLRHTDNDSADSLFGGGGADRFEAANAHPTYIDCGPGDGAGDVVYCDAFTTDTVVNAEGGDTIFVS